MSPILTETIDRVMTLPRDEQLTLLTFVWDHLAGESPLRSIDEEAVAIALERARQLETGEVEGISHDDFNAHLDRVMYEIDSSSENT